MISINLKGEYRADPWDYVQPRTFPGWFLAKRDRGGWLRHGGRGLLRLQGESGGATQKAVAGLAPHRHHGCRICC